MFGLGDWSGGAAFTARSLLGSYFLVTILGIEIATAGLVFLIPRIWDSINDPLMGIYSDRFQSKWGRRRPFMLLGAIPFGLFFFLSFTPPLSFITGHRATLVYYTVIFALLDTFYTLVNSPYSALTSELTDDYDERSSLAGWRMGNSIFAALFTAVLFQLLAEGPFAQLAGSKAGGFAISGAIWGVMITLTSLAVVIFVREPQRPNALKQPPFHFLQSVREAFQNETFRMGTAIYLLAFIAVDIITAVYVWFLKFYLQLSSQQAPLVLGMTLFVAFASMPLTVRLMQRYGKTTTYIRMMLFWACTMIIISLLPPNNFALALVAAGLAGLGYGAANAIPWAIVADAVEEDEWKTGTRREGMYASYLVTTRKVASAIALSLFVPFLLSWAGFLQGQVATQPESAVLMLRLLMGGVPTLLLLLSIYVAYRYPMSAESHAELVKKLQARRADTTSP